MSDRPRSVTVRTRYMTASTRPQARLQPRAATNIVRISSRPAVATDTAPTKVSAMNRPKSISDIRSTGFSTGSRTAFSMTLSSLIANDSPFDASIRPPHYSFANFDRPSVRVQHDARARQMANRKYRAGIKPGPAVDCGTGHRGQISRLPGTGDTNQNPTDVKATQPSTAALRFDVVAGLTAAAVVLPKAMAYATVAGLPVAVGLYTAFIPMIAYALLGSSRVLSVSSTTTLAILAGTQLGLAVPDGDPTKLVTATATLTALVGRKPPRLFSSLLKFIRSYYRIPVADRQALLEEEAQEEIRASAAEAAEDDAAAGRRRRRGRRGRGRAGSAAKFSGRCQAKRRRGS